MARIVIELPTASYEQLQQRAEAAGTSPEALSRALLEAALGASGAPAANGETESAPLASSERERQAPAAPTGDQPAEPPSAREILKAAGHLVELSPEMR